ncbi:hypothetical protein [Kineosporia sp. NBRC 101677]|uniref:hypothetical protein n=1 Tax=Kineosporia sp. NBRC 101677 TaxID=3032197 RepID=UPI0025568014|nr:hypothetical protein [Kineosporia sp. NBRC 101677]
MTTLQQDRIAEVSRRVSAAENSAALRHPAHAGAIRRVLTTLQGGLHQAHAQCASVDHQSWAAYVADLDHALAELDIELARAAEQHTGSDRDVEDVLVVHSTALELTGWRLRVSLLGDPAADPSGVRQRLAAAEQQLQSFRSDRGSDSPAAAESLATSVQEVRGGYPSTT